MIDLRLLIKILAFKPLRILPPFSWVGHMHFVSWLFQTFKPRTFVELGTHTGNSYFAICQTIEENNLQSLAYAVDNWEGDQHSGYYDNQIYNDVHNYNEEHYANFSKLMKTEFDQAVKFFDNGSIDLLHIDGHHTYEAVRHDFETWLPKLSRGAIVIFHDTAVMDRDFGVYKYFDELNQNYPLSMKFSHSYGLGVLQLNNHSSNFLDRLVRVNKPQLWLAPNFSQRADFINFFSSLGELFFAKVCSSENKEKIATYEQKIADYHNLVKALRGEK